MFYIIDMTDFRDPFPELSQVVDIGGDRYFMGSQKPIELGFKSRIDYINSFGTDRRAEYLIRKYLFLDLKSKRKLVFDPSDERNELITLLKKRSQQLKLSKEFTSSVLKNTLIQRSYINIEKLIQELEGNEYKGISFPKLPDISLPCSTAKKYIKSIPEDRLFQLILEIAWYLLHPDKLPKNIECDWAKLIKKLDTIRIGDIVSDIKNSDTNKQHSEQPFNYFKKINLQHITKADSLQNALDEAKEMAIQVQGENTNDTMKERIKTLLNILVIKKYLNNNVENDQDLMKIIDSPNAINNLTKTIITNPMSGGGHISNVENSQLNISVGIAMKPLFNYFKVVFDPIYSLLESSFNAYISKIKSTPTDKKVIIPMLTKLLHIANNIRPYDIVNTTGNKLNTYGIYKITNIDPSLLLFMNEMLESTRKYVNNFSQDTDKYTFNKQIFNLPKVRLSTVTNKYNTGYTDPKSIPYMQFFTVNGNIKLMPKNAFLKSNDPNMTSDTYKALNDFLTPDSIYISCTKSENAIEDIPMNVYSIDFEKVDFKSESLNIDNNITNYFNKNKTNNYKLDKLTALEKYVIYNNAELALSIFIAFKDLMPK